MLDSYAYQYTYDEQTMYSLNNITIDQPGFIFVYVSNESDVSNWVYFDDLKVTHTKNTVSQVAHYYPFGMTMDGALQSFGHSGGKGNKYLFNGMELNEELDQYTTGYRMYNPALGRFNGVDPVAGKYGSISPYNFAFNDPVYWSDPSGADPNRQYPNSQGYSDPHDDWWEWSSAPAYLGYTQSGWGHGFGGRFGSFSGNHWADPYRSMHGDYFVLSPEDFEAKYGQSRYECQAYLNGDATTYRPVNEGYYYNVTTPLGTSENYWMDDWVWVEDNTNEGSDPRLISHLKESHGYRGSKYLDNSTWLIDVNEKYTGPTKSGTFVHGKTLGEPKKRRATVYIHPGVLKDRNLFYLTMGHELIHVSHHVSGSYERWIKNSTEEYAYYLSEYYAWTWTRDQGTIASRFHPESRINYFYHMLPLSMRPNR